MNGAPEMFSGLFDREDDGDCVSLLPEAVISDLRERSALMKKDHNFKPGDIVRQVPCLAAYRIGDRPSIVLSVDEAETLHRLGVRESLLIGQPIVTANMIIGFIHKDGTYAEHAVDRRRFEPWSDTDGSAEKQTNPASEED